VAFARALCALKAGDGETGLRGLQGFANGRSRHAVRAAVALAATQAAAGEYTQAAAALIRAIQSPDVSSDGYYGEARCQAVVYTYRGGDVERARRLAVKLLGTGTTHGGDAILGVLLAHQACYEESRPFLESGLSAATAQTLGGRILRGVYGRIAARQCAAREFAATATLLEQAVKRTGDEDLRQLAELAKLSTQAGDGPLDGRAVGHLQRVLNALPNPDPGLVRTAAVAHQRWARAEVLAGRPGATKAWLQAADECLQRMKGPAFWSRYIQTYNTGKQYLLECPPEELEKRVLECMAAAALKLMGDALRGEATTEDAYRVSVAMPQYDLALTFWNSAKRLLGEAQARQMFPKVIDVDALRRRLRESDEDAAGALLMWIYENVEAKEEYKDEVCNSIVIQALEALVDGAITTFLSKLDQAGSFDADWKQIARQVGSLGTSLIHTIVSDVNEYRMVQQVKQANRSAYRSIVWRMVRCFADDVPGDLRSSAYAPHVISKLLPILVDDVLN
jgi:hypothetical protein